MTKTVTALFFIFGTLCLLYSSLLTWERTNPKRLSFAASPPQTNISTHEYPVRVTIPSIDADLPIIQSEIENNVWQTTSKGVSYLKSTPLPGEIGNSILYGHNWSNLLGKLSEVKPGNIITIEFNTGRTAEFIVSGTGTVSPNDIHVLYPSKDARITLYSCTGFLDSKRFVVTALARNLSSSVDGLEQGGASHEK